MFSKKLGLNGKTRIRLIGALAVAALVMCFQNCGSEKSFVGSNDLSSTSVGGDPGPITSGDPVQDSKVYNINYSENILTSLQNQTGVKTLATDTMASFRSQVTKMPDNMKVDGVTAPMWLSVTMVAAEVCKDLYTQDAAANPKRILSGVNLGASVSITSDMRNSMIRSMARLFWARNETPDELTMIRAALDGELPVASNVDSKKTFVFICTAMLASLDAQKQ